MSEGAGARRPQLARAYWTACPQLAKADVPALKRSSGCEPKRALARFIGCIMPTCPLTDPCPFDILRSLTLAGA
jgi:hypothetical protein